MTTLSTYLDADRKADLARDPCNLSPEAAMAALRRAQAAHPAFANRPMPEPDPLSPDVMTNLTSLQPLGFAQVLVCYESEDAITITGALIDGDFVDADQFSGKVICQWERAIELEVRRDSVMAGWES